MNRKLRIEIWYYWKLFKIHLRKHQRMLRLRFGGKLVKIAFVISPDLMDAMGYTRGKK